MATASFPRLKNRYNDEIRAQLKEELGLGNIMEVPRLTKIVINMGVGRATQQKSLIEGAMRDLESIAGQNEFCGSKFAIFHETALGGSGK